MKGYKVFDRNLACTPFSGTTKQYEIGKAYHEDGSHLGQKGMMHFFEYASDLLKTCPYIVHGACRFAEVEASGLIASEDTIRATTDLKIVREMSLSEVIRTASLEDKIIPGSYEKLDTLRISEKSDVRLNRERHKNVICSVDNSVLSFCTERAASIWNSGSGAVFEVRALAPFIFLNTGENAVFKIYGNHLTFYSQGKNTTVQVIGDYSSVTLQGESSTAIIKGCNSRLRLEGRGCTAQINSNGIVSNELDSLLVKE